MILYHYTSLETFFKIFNTKEEKITFWATNAYFMNDPKEIAYSFYIFIKSLQLYEEENDINEKKLSIFFLNTNFHNGLFEMTGTPFLISFSESCDDLSMWRFYGKNGNGVSIGIEKEYLLEFSKRKESNNTTLIKCIYEEKTLLEKLKVFWNEYYSSINFKEKSLDMARDVIASQVGDDSLLDSKGRKLCIFLIIMIAICILVGVLLVIFL